jgi:hypothetical protein
MGFDAGTALGTSFTAPWKARNARDFLERSAQGSLGYKLLVDPQVQSNRLQKANLKKQDLAQKESLAAASSERRTAGVAKKKAGQKTPNVAALLAAAQGAGVSNTLLSGFGGGLGGQPTTLGGR